MQEENNEIKKVLITLGEENEKAKYNKFRDFFENNVIDLEKSGEICEFCKKRFGENGVCKVCENEIKLGRLLTKYDYLQIDIKNDNLKDNEIEILKYKDNLYIARFLATENNAEYEISNDFMKNLPKWPLKAYVPEKTFEEIENNTRLAVLKADVDKLGKTFREFYFNSFKKFNRLSRELNFFFANYVPYLIKTKYQDGIYVVFAGGDDLFLVGRYDVIVDFAKELREKFYYFSLKKVTLSMGIVFFKHSTPISYVSEWADNAEKRAKDRDNGKRNGIDIFDITLEFDEFLKIDKKLNEIYEKYKDKFNTTTLYKLINIIQMADNLNDVKNALWISKLYYLINRNIKDEKLLKDLRDLIEKYKGKLLPSIYILIYKRRDYGV